jgi:hypothetical protein
MLLGDLLSRFSDEALASEFVLGHCELGLVAALRDAAETSGESLGVFVANCVQQYAAHASDEEWITLMGALARTPDPGGVCLKRALSYALASGRAAAADTPASFAAT